MKTDQNIGLRQWMQSVPDAVCAMFNGRIHLRRDRLDRPLTMSDGRTYVPFRETIKYGDVPEHPVVLHPRFHLRCFGPDRRVTHALFRRICIVTTPFFMGLGGYRSKLWMVDPATGDFAGLYEWDGADEARAYADGLARILRPLSSPGSVSYELVDNTTVDDYLAAAASTGSRVAMTMTIEAERTEAAAPANSARPLIWLIVAPVETGGQVSDSSTDDGPAA